MSDKIIEIASHLIKFKSVAENKDEIENCLNYCINYFKDKKVTVKKYEAENISPVIVISNCENNDFDIMTLGHIDVVPAEDSQFNPEIKDGKLFGRGALDMKTWVAVGMNSMDYILENNLPVKFAIVITTDEETTATGAKYLANNTDITAKIMLDVDVADDIGAIITKCKNVLMIDLEAKGKACHGSLPWQGRDAIEKIIRSITNLRAHFPHYAEDENKPSQDWVDTMHVGIISGGIATNVVAEKAYASLDFRLTEKLSRAEFLQILEKSLEKDVTYKIKMEADPVIVDENNPYFKKYKACVEKNIGREVEILHIGGATDSRHFSAKGMPTAMHSGSGHGMHGIGEYCTLESIEQLANIQIDFIKSF